MAVPMRAQVEPSSMATSKSCDIPMESSSRVTDGSWRAARRSRSSRNWRKWGRVPSGSSVKGGTVIRPQTRRCGQSGARVKTDSSSGSSGTMPLLARSPPMLISIRTSRVLPSLCAASFSRCASLAESMESTAWKISARFCCLVRLQVADHVEFGIFQVGELRKLVGEFLHAVLAK